jgi:hypothetical protein
MLQAIGPTLEHFTKSVQKVATDIKNNKWYREFVVSYSRSLFLRLSLFDFLLDQGSKYRCTVFGLERRGRVSTGQLGCSARDEPGVGLTTRPALAWDLTSSASYLNL